MSTRDTQMNQYLTVISQAVHGRDMRSALHDAIEKAYNDSYRWYDSTLGNANQALQKSTQALDIASSMGSTIDEIEDMASELDEKYDETAARIDNIIAHNNDTEGNTELIDIRTTYQGYTSTSAGSAVRLQARELNSRINTLVREQTATTVNLRAVPSYEEIWENSDPTTSFAGQSLTLSSVSDADENCEIMIIYLLQPLLTVNDTPDIKAVSIPMAQLASPGQSSYGVMRAFKVGSNGVDFCERQIAVSFDSSDYLEIEIGDCTVYAPENPFSIDDTDMTIADPSATASTSNGYLIPYKIYAISFGFVGSMQVSKDQEIIDARTGIDGTVYESLGEAIRSQISAYTASGIIEALNDDY